MLDGFLGAPPSAAFQPGASDYDKVRKAVGDLLEANPDYDDGNYGKLLCGASVPMKRVRLPASLSPPAQKAQPPCPHLRRPLAGPLLVRLAWHSAGTYDKNTGTGGSNGAMMRFSPEANWGANAGLAIARDLLEPVKAKFPWISYSDLWTLAGATAIEEMGGARAGVAGEAWEPGGGTMWLRGRAEPCAALARAAPELAGERPAKLCW